MTLSLTALAVRFDVAPAVIVEESYTFDITDLVLALFFVLDLLTISENFVKLNLVSTSESGSYYIEPRVGYPSVLRFYDCLD